MECLANYQQMVDPTMVWGTIKSNDVARMDVSFTWKKEESLFLELVQVLHTSQQIQLQHYVHLKLMQMLS